MSPGMDSRDGASVTRPRWTTICRAGELGLPVKWIDTRSEHMRDSHDGRDQVSYVTIGRQARRHDHRLAREDHRRFRRLQHAAHAADSVALGVCGVRRRALEGTVTAQDPEGQRSISAAALPQDYTETALGADAVLTEIRSPADLDASAEYKRHLARVMCECSLRQAAGL
jgi:hypothetical protein